MLLLSQSTGWEIQRLIEFLKRLASVLKLNKTHLPVKDHIPNKADFVEKLCSVRGRIMNLCHKVSGIEDMAATAWDLGMKID